MILLFSETASEMTGLADKAGFIHSSVCVSFFMSPQVMHNCIMFLACLSRCVSRANVVSPRGQAMLAVGQHTVCVGESIVVPTASAPLTKSVTTGIIPNNGIRR